MVSHGFKDSPLKFFSNLDRFPDKDIITFIWMLQLCTCTFQFISRLYMSTNKDRIFDDSISIFLYIYIEITQEKYFFYDSKTKLTKQY